MPDRNIGDIYARFRLIVDEHGTKQASAELDKFERKLDGGTGGLGRFSKAGISASDIMQGLAAGGAIAAAGLAAVTQNFLAAGRAGELSGDSFDKYLELDAALVDLQQSAQDAALTLAEELAPALANFAQLAADVAPVVGKIARVLSIVSGFDAAGKIVGYFEETTLDATDALREEERAAARLAKTMGQLEKVWQEDEKNLRAYVDAQLAAVDADFARQNAANSLEDAQKEATDAQAEYDEAVNRSGQFARDEADALDEVRDAQRRLTDARFAATRAADDLQEAQEALTVAQIEFGPGSYAAGEAADDLAESQHSLESANADVGEAAEDVTDKQRKYQETLEAGGPASREAKDAAEKLDRAQLGVKEAAVKAAKAVADYDAAIDLSNGHTQTAIERAEALAGALGDVVNLAGPALEAALARLTQIAVQFTPTLAPLATQDFASGAQQPAGTSSAAQATAAAGTTIGPNYITVTSESPEETARRLDEELGWLARTR